MGKRTPRLPGDGSGDRHPAAGLRNNSGVWRRRGTHPIWARPTGGMVDILSRRGIPGRAISGQKLSPGRTISPGRAANHPRSAHRMERRTPPKTQNPYAGIFGVHPWTSTPSQNSYGGGENPNQPANAIEICPRNRKAVFVLVERSQEVHVQGLPVPEGRWTPPPSGYNGQICRLSHRCHRERGNHTWWSTGRIASQKAQGGK